MILSREDIGALHLYKKAGYTVVTTNGCFDILHAGHIHYLRLAKGLGNKVTVVVLLNSDSSVHALKGEGRPLVPETERAAILDALRFVDFVVIFDELAPDALLREIKPHIHVKGGDYSVDELPEAELVRSLGGDVVTIGHVKGKSTTELIKDILSRFSGE